MKRSCTILCLSTLLATVSCNEDKSAPKPQQTTNAQSSGTTPGTTDTPPGGTTPQSPVTYTITWKANGGAHVDPLKVKPGETIAPPTAPQSSALPFAVDEINFHGWYTDAALQHKFDFTKPIASDTTLYARSAYLVSTAPQLSAMAADLHGLYTLQTDIDLQNAPWIPIGAEHTPFLGELNGKGHVVQNLHIDEPAGVEYVGLIGVNSGEVNNIGVEISKQGIKGGKTHKAVGALVGWNNARTALRIVQGVYATGGAVSGETNVGGLVGINNGVVYGYATQMQVTANGESAGGLVGLNTSHVYGYAVDIKVTSGGNNVGGLVGSSDGAVYGYAQGVIGAVNGAGRAGGLVGNSLGEVYGYFKGSVSGIGYVGGLVGAQDGGIVQGYVRATIGKAAGPNNNNNFGRLANDAPNPTDRSKVSGYYSAKETNFVGGITAKGASSQDGADITVVPGTVQGDFSRFTFDSRPGHWVWAADGAWPAIWLPPQVGGNYKPADQPIATP